MRTMTREFYDKLRAAAEEFGGVRSNVLHENKQPVCLWALAIYGGATKQFPYNGAPSEDDPAWLQQATEPSRDTSPNTLDLPYFMTIDNAVHRVRQQLGLPSYGSGGEIDNVPVPLDEVLKELNIEVLP